MNKKQIILVLIVAALVISSMIIIPILFSSNGIIANVYASDGRIDVGGQNASPYALAQDNGTVSYPIENATAIVYGTPEATANPSLETRYGVIVKWNGTQIVDEKISVVLSLRFNVGDYPVENFIFDITFEAYMGYNITFDYLFTMLVQPLVPVFEPVWDFERSGTTNTGFVTITTRLQQNDTYNYVVDGFVEFYLEVWVDVEPNMVTELFVHHARVAVSRS